MTRPEPTIEEKESLNRAGVCPICYEYGHPEEAHMEIENETKEIDAEQWWRECFLDDDEDEEMDLELEMQNYPERFWENPETGEWERW